MRAQGTRDTGPELALRCELHALGLRFRVQRKFAFEGRSSKVSRTVDVVFPAARVAVEVHGCFWHGCARCPWKPGSNDRWWLEKIGRNRARDVDTARRLRRDGWSVITVWEHEDPAGAARRVLRVVLDRKEEQ